MSSAAAVTPKTTTKGQRRRQMNRKVKKEGTGNGLKFLVVGALMVALLGSGAWGMISQAMSTRHRAEMVEQSRHIREKAEQLNLDEEQLRALYNVNITVDDYEQRVQASNATFDEIYMSQIRHFQELGLIPANATEAYDAQQELMRRAQMPGGEMNPEDYPEDVQEILRQLKANATREAMEAEMAAESAREPDSVVVDEE